MQPISILGPGAVDLVDRLVARLDGRLAVVRRVDDPAPNGDDSASTRNDGESPAPDRTRVALAPDGSWTGSGTVDGFDAVLDHLAPDHEWLIAVGYDRLRLPTVLLGPDHNPGDTPGDVIVHAEASDGVDVESLVTALDHAEPWVTREKLVARVEDSDDAERSGAIATFTGRVRARDTPDDDRTSHLAFERYEGVARERMDAIAAELTDREGVFEIAMHHRTGVVEAGEDIVFVVVLAGHREEAFRTVRDGIDRLKDEVPIFKKESTESEEFWVHQRE